MLKLAPCLGVGAFLVAVATVTSCRLGESPDDFAGGGTAGTGGGTSGSGGSGGLGGTGGAAGGAGAGATSGSAGSGGTDPNYVSCAETPTTCDDIGSDELSWMFGCCEGNVLHRCETDESSWQLTSTNCETTAEVCDYDLLSDAMACTQGSGGSGGSAPCESGECTGPCADCDDNPLDCETDTNSDPENCGECNHSCQGGVCSGGNCQAMVLAPNQKTPWGVAADSESVYWLVEGPSPDDGSVFSVPVGGGMPEELAAAQNGPVQLTMYDDYLFWTNFQGGGSVRSMRKDGTDLSTLAQAGGPWAITSDDSFIYWTNTSDGSIRRVVHSGGQAVLLVSGESGPRGIVVDGTHVYWTASTSGQVRRAELNGNADETLTSNQAYPLGIAVDALWVYWTEVGASYSAGDCTEADGRIMRADKTDGSNQEELATSQACPMNLVLSGNTLYWTNAGTVTGSTYNNDGTVQQVATNGDDLGLVATGQDRPYGIAVTADAVYWTNQGVLKGQGSVMKVAK